MKRLAPLAALLIAGCSTVQQEIDYANPPAADWPPMTVAIYHAGEKRFNEICGVPVSGRRRSCAHIDLVGRRCSILVREGETLDAYAEKHERAHCAGYDHVGENDIHEAWAKQRAR